MEEDNLRKLGYLSTIPKLSAYLSLHFLFCTSEKGEDSFFGDHSYSLPIVELKEFLGLFLDRSRKLYFHILNILKEPNQINIQIKFLLLQGTTSVQT